MRNLAGKLYKEELKIKNQNSEFNKISNDIKTVEVKIGKYDVKLDLLLNSLSEDYHMTYDKAKNEYVLDLIILTFTICPTRVSSPLKWTNLLLSV